jgi:predicted nucleic acid-binding protein
LLVDTSVVIKWFHSKGESDVLPARALRDAHLRGEVEARVLDLGLYEVGNVLVRALRWPGPKVADQLDDLVAICGVPLSLSAGLLRDASHLAADHGLSYYDAAWAAASRAFGVPLVSADRKLVAAGLAESPATMVQRMSL